MVEKKQPKNTLSEANFNYSETKCDPLLFSCVQETDPAQIWNERESGVKREREGGGGERKEEKRKKKEKEKERSESGVGMSGRKKALLTRLDQACAISKIQENDSPL